MISIDRILLPVDFSKNAEKAIPHALSLAQEYGAELHLIHVIDDKQFLSHAVFDGAPYDPSLLLEDLMKDRTKRLEKMAAELPTEVKTTPHVKLGSPAVEIAEAAAALKVDLVIIGTHGHTGLSHLLFGSVAERVVRHAPCPVLVIREIAAKGVTGEQKEKNKTPG